MANKSKVKRTETVNPYTFVPLRGYAKKDKFKVMPETPAEPQHEELYWGKFHCRMTAKTELAIPDASKAITYTDPEKKGMKSFPFFTVGDKPAIPGSSLRGPIRSVFETITNSCVHTNDSHFHGQSARKVAGILECVNGSFRLYPAQRYPLFDDDEASSVDAIDSLANGQEVHFRLKTVKARKIALLDPNGVAGVFLRVNIFKNENSETGGPSHPSIFQRNGSSYNAIDPVYIDCLEENIDLYDLEEKPDPITGKREQKQRGKEYREAFEKMKAGEAVLPVWYLKSANGYEFAPSQMSRSVYPKKVTDFLSEIGLDPCQIPENCCPACNLFGMISVENKKAKAGRVRFSDAELCGDEAKMRKVIFPAMMGPKTSAFEFYLNNSDKNKAFSFDLWDEKTRLSGRKMYWHHSNGLGDFNQKIDPERPDLQSEYEVLQKGAIFEFDVFFDGVTKMELNQLAYALTIGEYLGSDGKEYCHKIGHGKPLGLGSVAISLEECMIRSYGELAYGVASDGSWMMPRDEIEAALSSLANLKMVVNFNAISSEKKIDYPRNDEGEIFGWFADNRDAFDDGGLHLYVETLKRCVPGYNFNEEFGNEISQYNDMKRQDKAAKKEKDEGFNSAFAALKGFKFD